MTENVHTFINMASLQEDYGSVECQIPPAHREKIKLEPGKRLLLLDMDETLLHAATINDIYVQQIYGPNPKPDFFTSF